MLDIKETARKLCSLPGPSGYEGRAAAAAAELLGGFMDKTVIDRLGNVIGEKLCGKKDALKLMLDAHIDEIGLMVTGIEEGFLRFRTIGGVDPRMLPNREVLILTEKPVYGVITCLPPHVQDRETIEEATPVSKMYIDAGFDETTARKLIKVGTPVVFAGEFAELSNNIISSKAFDDRLCFVSILKALEFMKDKEIGVDLYVLGSVQEEVGGRGAIVGAYAANPDFCIAVDVTHAATPDASKDKTYTLGGGVAIGLGPNTDRKFGRVLVNLARDKEIPHQIEVMPGNSGTNGWPIQISREGVKTAILSVPVKYMHSPIETADIGDVESTARLICEFAEYLGKGAPELA